ncbi:unnamed protein product [Effrenium voratum]|nr:unnamed protein product [Effrenium voratum]
MVGIACIACLLSAAITFVPPIKMTGLAIAAVPLLSAAPAAVQGSTMQTSPLTGPEFSQLATVVALLLSLVVSFLNQNVSRVEAEVKEVKRDLGEVKDMMKLRFLLGFALVSIEIARDAGYPIHKV